MFESTEECREAGSNWKRYDHWQRWVHWVRPPSIQLYPKGSPLLCLLRAWAYISSRNLKSSWSEWLRVCWEAFVHGSPAFLHILWEKHWPTFIPDSLFKNVSIARALNDNCVILQSKRYVCSLSIEWRQHLLLEQRMNMPSPMIKHQVL